VTKAHEYLAAWESYYVILGSSAAALTGLQFVVIALVADMAESRSEDSVNAFATPTVVHFCMCLLIAAVLSAPWRSMTPVVSLLSITGIAGIAYTLLALRRARRQTSYRPVAEDWLWHVILPLVSYCVLFGASLLLARDPESALFPVGAVALMLIFIGIHNAWDAVAYFVVQPRGKGRDS
jgi:hypothetical protein